VSATNNKQTSLTHSSRPGTEVVSHFKTDIHNAGVFYTDANGRQMLQRTYGHYPTFDYDNAEPVAGNYYPVNSRIFIRVS
jgi:lysosomal alpha-mannosidase